MSGLCVLIDCTMCLALWFVCKFVFHGLLLRWGGLMWVSESMAYLNRGFMIKVWSFLFNILVTICASMIL
jgi:hypothetical protein